LRAAAKRRPGKWSRRRRKSFTGKPGEKLRRSFLTNAHIPENNFIFVPGWDYLLKL
jgi:hypothetical protein